MPFASPISPPPLKPHVLPTSPAAAGRRSSIAPGQVVDDGSLNRLKASRDLVFDGALPAVPLVWNPRLTATAGQVVDDGSLNRLKASRQERIPVRLELSTKVLDCEAWLRTTLAHEASALQLVLECEARLRTTLAHFMFVMPHVLDCEARLRTTLAHFMFVMPHVLDCEARLRTTLAHEMCHVAAWAVSKEYAQHHGPAFWAWARRVEARLPGIKVTTCHSYEVHAPFRWQCANNSCGKQYHRHKRSIDPAKHVCSRCSGRLLYLGKFSRDGKLVGSTAAGAATPGATPGGNAFSQFVKSHFAQTKRELPAGTPHKELMSRLAADYKLHKESVQKQQQQQASPQAAQQLDLQPVWQQQQLDEALLGQSQLEVVELSDSEDEAGSGSRQQEQQQHDGQERLTDQEDVGGLLSFLQRLDLASTE
ncbi:hypothetical protein OEZ85_002010 [Tetradesmus obliquus]|uniref:SprT-like domain-containing protein n=1 Tax=Tetradesmus obliquus TaxID=3088 RepID=A0ABY8U1T2_TETOB|nr:hypothetical protein OEZ85_002010 [Tetradesmus obliquus]